MTTTRPRPAPRRAGTPRPHPAFVRRRRAVRGIPGRGQTVLAAGVALAAALAGYWLATGPVLSVRDVRLSGYDRADAAPLQQAVHDAGMRGGSLLAPPVGTIRRQAMRFPWVQDVTVARDWPLGLVVQVIPAEPIAVGVPGRGPRVFISARGLVMGPATRMAGLPRIVLPGPSPAMGETVPAAGRAALLFVRHSDPGTAARFRRLRLKDGRLVGRLAGGPELIIGAPVALRAKALSLQAVLNHASSEEENAATYVDVSVPEHPALGTLSPDPPPPPAPAATTPPVATPSATPAAPGATPAASTATPAVAAPASSPATVAPDAVPAAGAPSASPAPVAPTTPAPSGSPVSPSSGG